MKKLLPAILVILYPYCIVFLLLSIFSQSPIMEHIMEHIFLNNVFVALLYLGVVWLMALASTLIIYHRNLYGEKDALEIARTIMLIKLIQIPAYAVLLFAAFLCLITIFTMAISVMLIVLAAGSILLSGLIGLSVVKRCYMEGILSRAELHFHDILQFLFYFDVVSAVKVYQKAKIITEKRSVCFHFGLEQPNP